MAAYEDKTEWVAIVRDENDSDEPIEIESESDGTLLLTSVTAQFPGTSGLKYRNGSTGSVRGIRCVDNVLFPPAKQGWGEVRYICVRLQSEDKKRKHDALEVSGENSSKSLKTRSAYDDEDVNNGSQQTVDLIVLGLSFKVSEEDVKKYFEDYGEVAMMQLKKKPNGQSRGFGFLRFADMAAQEKVQLQRHLIGGRWCDVKMPESQQIQADIINKLEDNCKIFIYRIAKNISVDELRSHFEQFGEITDVFCPDPFRGFAFVTFVESRVAQSLIGKDHVIKGISVQIGQANPRGGKNDSIGKRGGRGGGGGEMYGVNDYGVGSVVGVGGVGGRRVDWGQRPGGGYEAGGFSGNPWIGGGVQERGYYY